jgi:hypothetical protein
MEDVIAGRVRGRGVAFNFCLKTFCPAAAEASIYISCSKASKIATKKYAADV